MVTIAQKNTMEVAMITVYGHEQGVTITGEIVFNI